MRLRAGILAAATAAIIPASLAAETLIAARTLRAQTVIAPEDVALDRSADAPGALQDAALVIGRETRIAIFRGQPLRAADLTDPALVERNQIVPLIFRRGALEIHADARALDRAISGDMLRVMNLASRAVVTGQVMPDGSVRVLATR